MGTQGKPQDSQSPDSPGPTEYEVGDVSTQPRSSVSLLVLELYRKDKKLGIWLAYFTNK
jgi:hypothetical protein